MSYSSIKLKIKGDYLTIIIKNHKKIYENVIKLLPYLNELWKINYFPNIEKLMHEFEARDIKNEARLKNALEHLVKRRFVTIDYDEDGTLRVKKGLNPIPEIYSNEDYFFK